MTRLIRESSGASSWFDCCVFSSQAEQWFWFWVLGVALRRRCSAFCVDLMWRRGGKVYTARFVGDEVKEKLFLGFPFRARCSKPCKFKVHHITWYTYPSHTASPRCHSRLHLPLFIQCVWCFSLQVFRILASFILEHLSYLLWYPYPVSQVPFSPRMFHTSEFSPLFSSSGQARSVGFLILKFELKQYNSCEETIHLWLSPGRNFFSFLIP